jgi:serine/threonine-protein kinase
MVGCVCLILPFVAQAGVEVAFLTHVQSTTNPSQRDASATRRRRPNGAQSIQAPASFEPARVDLTGSVLGDRYRVDAVLAEGGMGIVYRGWHLVLDLPVAIKVIREEYQAHGEVLERFYREARALASLKNGHTARIMDIGRTPDNRPFMVMEYLDGQDLQLVLMDRGPLPVQQAVSWLLQITGAVAEAHSKGLVHRDLKPNNMVLTRGVDGSPILKLIDFGISKSLAREPRYRTASRDCLGSPQYMSPEQTRSARDVDARTDVWALGVVLYELLTGSCPFSGATLPAMVSSILHNAPAPPRRLRPDVPPEIEDIIHRCLEKRRDDRYATAHELQEALERYLDTVESSSGVELSVPLPRARADLVDLAASRVEHQSVTPIPLASLPVRPGLVAARGSRFGIVRSGVAAAVVLVVLVGAAHYQGVSVSWTQHSPSFQSGVGPTPAIRGTPAPVQLPPLADKTLEPSPQPGPVDNNLSQRTLARSPEVRTEAKRNTEPAQRPRSRHPAHVSRIVPRERGESERAEAELRAEARARLERESRSRSRRALLQAESSVPEKPIMQQIEDRYALTYDPSN